MNSKSKNKKIYKSLIWNILQQVERFNIAIERHKNETSYSDLMVLQYQYQRDEMTVFLLDCLVEMDLKQLLRSYVQKMDAPLAA